MGFDVGGRLGGRGPSWRHSSCPPGSAAAKSTTTTTHPSAPKLNVVGHVRFWECPSKSTEMLVDREHPHAAPRVHADAHLPRQEPGPSSCNYTAPYASVAPGPTSTALEAGPCGSIGFEIETSHGHEVWPGPQSSTARPWASPSSPPAPRSRARASWNQDKPNSTQRVAPGVYKVVVDNKHFTFPLHVAKS